jgi:DNA-binding NarL/FixJ family response regulator
MANADLPALVGRAAQLDMLNEALTTVLDGRFSVVEICGEPGIGKTRMLAELAELARAAGLLVCAGKATEFEQGVPYAVYAEMLSRLGHDTDASPPADRSGRDHMYAAVRRMLRDTDAPGVAVLIDDAHWADSASLDLTEHLIANPPGRPMLIAVTFRSACPPARLVDAIGRQPAAATRLALEPLGPADLERLLGDVSRHRRDMLLRASGGNPLYVQALSRMPDRTLAGLVALAARTEPGDPHWLDRSQRHVLAGLAAEITAQPDAVRRVAYAAAVVGDHATLDLVAHVTGLSEDTVVDAADQLDRLGLLQVDGARLEFRHPLMRAAAHELTGPAWRFEVHARTAGYLRTREAPQRLVAHHTERSARHGDETAIATLVEAGIAFAYQAPAEAAQWLGTALRIMPDAGRHDERRSLVSLWYARALGRGGQLERSREVLQHLRAAGGPRRREAETFSVVVARQLGDFAEAVALLEDRLSADTQVPAEACKLHVELAAIEAFREDPDGAVRHAERALGLLADNRSGLAASAQVLRALGALYAGRAWPARAYLADVVRTVDAAGDADLRSHVEILAPLSMVEIFLGHLPDAARHLARARKIAEALGPSSAAPYLLVFEAALQARIGQPADAVRLAEAAGAAARHIGSPEMGAMADVVRLRPLTWTAGPAAAAAVAGGLAEDDRPRSRAWWRIARVNLAAVRLAAGDGAGCLDLLDDGPSPWPANQPIAATRHALRAFAWASTGDLDAAWAGADRAEAIAADAGLDYEAALGCHAHAYVAYRAGKPDRALALAATAATRYAQARAPVEEAMCHHLAGSVHRRDNRAAAAAASYARAEAGYRATGAAWLLSTLSARLGHSASEGRLALTSRELEVAELVAVGLTNKEIAERLFLSRRTVESHLTRIFAKLDVRSRTAMARRLRD